MSSFVEKVSAIVDVDCEDTAVDNAHAPDVCRDKIVYRDVIILRYYIRQFASWLA